ncbi:MAG TPA: type II secretion system F family protein, partial [Micavibrio sp.]
MTFILIFVCAFAVFVAFSLLALKQMEKAKNQRALAVIRGQAVMERKDKNDKNSQNKRREEIARRLKQGQDSEKEKKKASIDMRLKQAGMTITPKQFWLFSFLFMIVAVMLSALLKLSPVAIVLIAITAFLGVPRYVLGWKTRRRQKKFLGDFADALEAMVRLLKAGMPVTEAIHMAGEEFEGPMGEEMQLMYESQRVGMSLPEAALMCARRMPVPEMQMFATGMAIQQQTGASLSEVLT